MRKLSVLSIISVMCLFLSSTNANVKTLETEDRSVRNFHAITSGGSFNVFVKIGKTESLKIEAISEDLQRIETIVQNGMLKIKYKRDYNNWSNTLGKVNIYITAVKLDGMILSGSGSMELEGMMTSASADFKLSGSGKIKATVDTQSVGVTMSGPGSLFLEGKTGVLNVSISGSGSLNGEDLVAETGTVNLVGSGHVYVHTTQSLKANLIGSGNVKYKGNPEVSISKAGSGDVSPLK